jgi:protein CrcB
LWVALGGALGSVARFWLNNAVAAALGAEFPWGTLLINVIGSFVISFFGTITVRASRFEVPPEIAIFVMVGICGGFTTFSSFSLQTIQLARGGEWDRAIWYVIASVMLCLLFCWLGLAAALAVTDRTAGPAAAMRQGVAAEPSDAATANGAVLALLPEGENAAALLDSARAVAGIFGRPLMALHVRIDPETTIIPSAEVLTEAQAGEISRTQAARHAQVVREITAWKARSGGTLRLLESFGDETTETARTGKDAAVIVAKLPAESTPDRGVLNAAIFDTGCPVLALPQGRVFQPAGHVAIGWKDAGSAPDAVRAALPLIAQSKQITIIAIGDAERLKTGHALALLGADGARAEVINPPSDGTPVGRQLLVQAHLAGADTLVLGAQRHGRVAEWMLGGVTGSVLASADIPLFLKQ